MPHINDKLDFTAEVFVVYENKILLKKHDKYKIWLSVGGHIEPGEDPNEAAIREVKEEVGLEVVLYNIRPMPNLNAENFKEIIPPVYINRHNINEIHEHVTNIYFAYSKTNNIILSETEKTDECKWFSKQDLETTNENISSLIKFYALEALEKLKND